MAFPLFRRSSRPLDRSTDEKDFGLLQEYARARSLRTYRNALFCRKHPEVNLPLVLFDPRRGLYLFDHASWSYEALRSAKASRAHAAPKTARDVNVDTAHRILRQKLDATDAAQSCEICNFLYLPHLSSREFRQLDPSFARLLPESRVIFADDTLDSIEEKLTHGLPYRDTSLESRKVLGSLFPHYALHRERLTKNPIQPSYHQLQYLEAALPERSFLVGNYGSGKSTILLLKAVHEQLRDPALRIAILAPTVVACELMYRMLLETIEHAMLPLDPTAIRILTPRQLIREHYLKSHGKTPPNEGEITPKMMRKPYRFADLLFCDDAHLLPEGQLQYLRHLQQNGALHVAALAPREREAGTAYPLPHGFRSPWALSRYSRRDSMEASQRLHRIDGNPYIHTLLLLTRLLAENSAGDILIVTPELHSARELIEEIKGYVGCNPQLLDPHKSLLNQNMEELLLVKADGLSGLQRPHVIIIDNGELGEALRAHAVSRACSHAYIITQGAPHGKSPQE